MSRYRHLETRHEDGVEVVQFIDTQLYEFALLNEVQDELLELAESGVADRVLIDFIGVEFCSTSLLNSLLRVQRELAAHDGRLALCGMHKSVREAFRMLNLDGTVFTVLDSTDAGIAALREDVS